MSCQLIRLGSTFALQITETLFGYQTIYPIRLTAQLQLHFQPYVGQNVTQILWNGHQLQSYPPQYSLMLVFANGFKFGLNLSSTQFQYLSQNCKITKI